MYPSHFTITSDEVDAIIKEWINFNNLGDRYQFMDADRPIGKYMTNNGKIVVDTTRMKVHQSKKRCHAVSALPKEMLKDENNSKN